MPKHDVDIDIGKIILRTLDEKERNVTWLAKKIGGDESNLRKTLNNSRFVYYDLVYKISKALEVDFFVYGSQKLNDNGRLCLPCPPKPP